MIAVMVCGSEGRMGRVVGGLTATERDMKIVAGVDLCPNSESHPYPVYRTPFDYKGTVDVAIDFSHPDSLTALLAFCLEKKTALAIATTGHSSAQLQAIRRAADKIPILYSANMSVGINVLVKALETISAALGRDFDMEIIEKHHSGKSDSPSGTACLLAKIINEASGNFKRLVYGRKGGNTKRRKNEIGIHSLRCGAMPGEHTVIFAGPNEVIEVKHTALSRNAFGLGAIKAIRFLSGAEPGLYTMGDVL